MICDRNVTPAHIKEIFGTFGEVNNVRIYSIAHAGQACLECSEQMLTYVYVCS
jgi:hypothetical protein